ncbi:hypothetical protein C8Q80DRAFT_1336730 [Daedaleopsis nitida]|nr:hypothetical protein C8Q80DRAFT_1336730 [Daedaleopsis nitida]
MSGRCEECGANTVWDQDVGSAICAQCGTLADPTQSVLVSHHEYADTSGREYPVHLDASGARTLHGRNGRVLAGQEKEARNRRNLIAMHEFIRTLAVRLSNPGVTPRAQGIFDQAMRVGQYRWGRKAKLTAGAALAIALRESHKSDAIRDIAYLLDESPTALSRAFMKVVEILCLNLSLAEPTIHLPMLRTHLVSLLDGSSSEATPPLPAQLAKVLCPLNSHLASITCTASALSALLARNATLAHLPTPPTACALFMLAIEAELASSLPNAGVFAQALGARFGAGKGVVMQRYKQIYDIVEEWIRDVPWLDGHHRKKAKGKEGAGRSKVAKRVVVARGLKDVVQFQDELWRKRIEGGGRPLLQLDIDEKDADAAEDEWDGTEQGSSTLCSRQSSRTPSVTDDSVPSHPAKRAKTKIRHPKSVLDASQFLLRPLSAALPSPSPPSPSHTDSNRAPDLLTHLLTADAAALPHAFLRAPTRLQLLASARGARTSSTSPTTSSSPMEAEAVRIAMGWDCDPDPDPDPEEGLGSRARGKKRKRDERELDVAGLESSDAGRGGTRGSKKIDMDALARLLDPDADLDVDLAQHLAEDPFDYESGVGGSEHVEEDWDGDENGIGEGEEAASERDLGGMAMPSMRCAVAAGDTEEEVVEEWRPMSPGGGGGFADEWYDF